MAWIPDYWYRHEPKIQTIRVLRDFPPNRVLGPVWKAGEIITGIRFELASIKGWKARESTTEPVVWILEEGKDAELVEEEKQ